MTDAKPIHPAIPLLLSINGGYVDTMGFLALQGLFTAHVTGNFVTLGASLVSGTSGVLAKLIALPVFCATIIMARLFALTIAARGRPVLFILLWVKAGLLTASAVLAIRLGPFHNGDAWPALLTGQVLVIAMALQNAVSRIHLGSFPPSTLMTGTTTQLMIDVADILKGGAPAPADQATKDRGKRLAAATVAFAGGCAAAALLYAKTGMFCFILPPLIAVSTLIWNAWRRAGP